MFNKFTSNDPGQKAGKQSGFGKLLKEKEMFEKLERIGESYVDAAIRSVKGKTDRTRDFNFQ
jgi:hypothetical protein